MDDKVEPSCYDENPDNVRLVVEDIFKYWLKRYGDQRDIHPFPTRRSADL